MNVVEILERALTEAGQAMDDSICEAIDMLRGPEPDWSEAPEWAQWWAADCDGVAFWSERQPMADGAAWAGVPRFRERPAPRVDLPLGVDWRLTLRERPESGE